MVSATAQIISTKVISLLPVIAAASETAAGVLTDRWSPLINLGAIGCVLGWFLIKLEPRLRRMEQAIDRSSRAQLMLLIGIRGIEPAVKDQAQTLLKEIEEAQERRQEAV